MADITHSNQHDGAHTLVSRLWTATLLSGVVTAILGVLVLVWPGKSLIVASALFGAYLLISGIAQVIFAFTLHVSAGARFLLFVSGAASVVLAVLAFRHFGEGYAILLLAIWIAVGFIFRGVATTAMGISDRFLPGRGWAIFFGVITILAGLVVLAWPFDSIAILTLVVGSWLVVIGLFEIVEAFMIRKDVNTLKDTAQKIESRLHQGRTP
jgi:uncharacterized membrane protein HdeD (DUF308 family)